MLIACAGTKINTSTVETGGTKLGSGSLELASENKQATGAQQPTQAKPATEAKQKEEPKCPRCQRIAERLALDESVLSDPTTGKEFKAFILREMHLVNQQREHCWRDECGTTVSHGTATEDATSKSLTRTSNPSR